MGVVPLVGPAVGGHLAGMVEEIFEGRVGFLGLLGLFRLLPCVLFTGIAIPLIFVVVRGGRDGGRSPVLGGQAAVLAGGRSAAGAQMPGPLMQGVVVPLLRRLQSPLRRVGCFLVAPCLGGLEVFDRIVDVRGERGQFVGIFPGSPLKIRLALRGGTVRPKGDECQKGDAGQGRCRTLLLPEEGEQDGQGARDERDEDGPAQPEQIHARAGGEAKGHTAQEADDAFFRGDLLAGTLFEKAQQEAEDEAALLPDAADEQHGGGDADQSFLPPLRDVQETVDQKRYGHAAEER